MKFVFVSFLVFVLVPSVFAVNINVSETSFSFDFVTSGSFISYDSPEFYTVQNYNLNYSDNVIDELKYDFITQASENYQSQIKIYEKDSATYNNVCTTSLGTTGVHDCTFNYDFDILYDKMLYASVCSSNNDCSPSIPIPIVFRESIDYLSNEIHFTLDYHNSSSFKSYNSSEFYTIEQVTLNYSDNIIDELMYDIITQTSTNYPTMIKIFEKDGANYNTICTTNYAVNGIHNCTFNYDSDILADKMIYVSVCSSIYDCSSSIAVPLVFKDSVEFLHPETVFTLDFVLISSGSVSYISPTPSHNSKYYNPKNFTFKIDATTDIISGAVLEINNQNFTMINNAGIYTYVYNMSEITSIEPINFQVHYTKSGIDSSLDQRTVYVYPQRGSAADVPFASSFIYLLSFLLVLFPLKIKSKKALGPVVATALLLVVAVVALVSFSSWYNSYQDDMLMKTEGKSEISGLLSIERIEQSPTGTSIFITNKKNIFYVIEEIKINSNVCSLDGSNIIGESSTTQVDVGCFLNKGQDAEVLIVTDLGIFTKEEIVR